MRSKTRKFIWSAPLVAALAIIGALTLAGVLLMPNADTAEAQTAPGVPSLSVEAQSNAEIELKTLTASQQPADAPTSYMTCSSCGMASTTTFTDVTLTLIPDGTGG